MMTDALTSTLDASLTQKKKQRRQTHISDVRTGKLHSTTDCSLLLRTLGRTTISVYKGFDRDLLSANDIIGENKVNLKQVFEDVTLTKKPISLCKKYYELVLKPQGIKMEFKDDTTFWVELETRNDKGKLEKTGKIRIQLDVMPMEFADQNKVGEAQTRAKLQSILTTPSW